VLYHNSNGKLRHVGESVAGSNGGWNGDAVERAKEEAAAAAAVKGERRGVHLLVVVQGYLSMSERKQSKYKMRGCLYVSKTYILALCSLPFAKFIPRPLIGSEKDGTTNTDPSSPWARSTEQTSKSFITPCLCKDAHSTSSPYCSSSVVLSLVSTILVLSMPKAVVAPAATALAALPNSADSVAVTMPFAQLCFRSCCNEYKGLSCSHRVNWTIVNRVSRMTVTPAPL
jgi:hypothetical protein